MTDYLVVKTNLSDFQKQKIKKAIKQNNSVNVRISKLSGNDEILLTNTQVNHLKKAIDMGKGANVMLSKTQLNEMKSGGFLGALLGGLAASLLPGLLSGKGLGSDRSGDKVQTLTEGRGVDGAGLFLRAHPQTTRVFVKEGGSLYDVTDVKDGSGIGSVIASFLPKVLPVLKNLGKSLLGGLAVGAASEGASQIVKKIAGKKGSGIFLRRGGKIYDITDIARRQYNVSGNGLLSKIFGFKSPVKNIPILNLLI